MELEPNTRLFIVAGKNVDENVLTESFRVFGTILGVKVVKEKGVAYINYDKASSAAMAIENLHETILNDGKGPMVKVMFAEAPKSGQGRKHGAGSSLSGEGKGVADPDNVPPQSRLFIVVPKTSDGSLIEAEMASFDDLEYCKTDLIAAKGIVFCKYSKTSSALKALESVQQTGMLAGYKVKCMLAEPKGKRGRQEFSGYSDPSSPMYHAPNLSVDPVGMLNHAASLASSLSTGSYLGGYPVSPSHSAFSGASEARAPSLQSVWAPSYHHGYSAARQALDMQAAQLWNGSPADSGLTLGNMPSQTAEFGSLGPGLNLDHLAELQADAVAKGALNMDRHVEAAAVRGALHLERSQPLSNLEISALAQKVSQEGIGAFDFSAETMNKLTAPLSADVAAPVTADLGMPLSAPSTALQPFYKAPAPGSGVQVFAAVAKDASEQELGQIFGSVPGLEHCKMLPHQHTGVFEGLISVTYSNTIAAINAVQKLNGHFLRGYPIKMILPDDPPGHQHHASARSSSIISDSNDAACVRRSSPQEDAPESRHRSSRGNLIELGRIKTKEDPPETRQRSSRGNLAELGRLKSSEDAPASRQRSSRGNLAGLGRVQTTEVAAVQDSLSHLSMPQRPEEPRGPLLTNRQLPQSRARRQDIGYAETEGQAESQSQPQPVENPMSEDAKRKTVYTLLKRPLPDYAIEHFFNTTCGPVQFVRLHPENHCVGAVQFQTAEDAEKARNSLGQAQICGLDLEVSSHNPIDSMRKKRARRGA